MLPVLPMTLAASSTRLSAWSRLMPCHTPLLGANIVTLNVVWATTLVATGVLTVTL
jgi:hypothetical protein